MTDASATFQQPTESEREMSTHERPIVVGVDGSAPADAALRWAIREALRRGGSLALVHCLPIAQMALPMGGVSSPAAFEEIRAGGQGILEDAVRQVAALAPDIATSSHLMTGAPVDSLRGWWEHADMIVIGAQGRHQLTEAFLGSVAFRLAGTVRCPVIVVRADYGDPSEQQPIVVGVDGSPGSEAALEFAFDIASQRHQRLLALRVWDDTYLAGGLRTYPLELDLDRIDSDQADALREQVAAWAAKYPDVVVVETVRRGHPAAELVRFAATPPTEADPGTGLLVVGSRGRGGFAGLLLGSVSHAVLTHATCPVAVVRHS